jgi:hypothetical protein
MTVRSRGAHPSETIKQLLKTRINPGEIKVGVNTFKSINSGELIETNSKGEIEVLDKGIQAKCGEELQAHIHTLRKPRLIILNVPEDTSTSITSIPAGLVLCLGYDPEKCCANQT